MALWSVAFLELDSHPDHNKVPDHAACAFLVTNIIDPRSYPRSNPLIARTLSEVFNVHGTQVLSLSRPTIIEPLTFPCRADALHMPRTRTLLFISF